MVIDHDGSNEIQKQRSKKFQQINGLNSEVAEKKGSFNKLPQSHENN